MFKTSHLLFVLSIAIGSLESVEPPNYRFLKDVYHIPTNRYNSINEFIASSDTADGGTNWAVLVAGSNTWRNYRHQADVCHAYHILINHGIKPENIITMMYDDIAFNEQNPLQGQIFNIPKGPNVYPGVQIDYRGDDVTPENFLGILTGDQKLRAQGRKVLNSSRTDKVFVYFADHGAPGLIGFPNSYLHAEDLMYAFWTMQKQRMYKEMVVYIEACESGSMFYEGLLPENMNIYAVTAANAIESSYACFYDLRVNNYLGDCFSVNWMMDSDEKDLRQETLQQQYNIVKNETRLSHVMQFGQMNISNEKVAQFQGNMNALKSFNTKETILTAKQLMLSGKAVKQEDVPLAILTEQLRNAKLDPIERKRIESKSLELIQKSFAIETTFRRIIEKINPRKEFVKEIFNKRTIRPINRSCYRSLVEHFQKRCYKISEFSGHEVIRHFHTLVNLCSYNFQIDILRNAVDAVCQVE